MGENRLKIGWGENGFSVFVSFGSPCGAQCRRQWVVDERALVVSDLVAGVLGDAFGDVTSRRPKYLGCVNSLR